MRGVLDVLYLYYYINNYTDHMFQKKSKSVCWFVYAYVFFCDHVYAYV
jgi:hypothetical protein